MTRYYNKNSLIKLLPDKFSRAWNDILSGKSLYKTWDKRILNFGLFTEEQICTKKERKERVGAIYSTKPAKETGYRISHINRTNKRRSNRRRTKLHND